MNLTREDMLRELELLPVWQQRNQRPQAEVVEVAEKHVAEPETEPLALNTLRMLVSEDSNYLFLLAPMQTPDEETLLQNMLKSIAAKSRIDIASAGISQLTDYPVKVILAMGEMAVKSLLNSTETLDELRGRLHMHSNLPVIVTYHPNHLLLNGADKAKAWEDLCLARTTAQSL
jgi:uracil-DNA glycosylase